MFGMVALSFVRVLVFFFYIFNATYIHKDVNTEIENMKSVVVKARFSVPESLFYFNIVL